MLPQKLFIAVIFAVSVTWTLPASSTKPMGDPRGKIHLLYSNPNDNYTALIARRLGIYYKAHTHTTVEALISVLNNSNNSRVKRAAIASLGKVSLQKNRVFSIYMTKLRDRNQPKDVHDEIIYALLPWKGFITGYKEKLSSANRQTLTTFFDNRLLDESKPLKSRVFSAIIWMHLIELTKKWTPEEAHALALDKAALADTIYRQVLASDRIIPIFVRALNDNLYAQFNKETQGQTRDILTMRLADLSRITLNNDYNEAIIQAFIRVLHDRN